MPNIYHFATPVALPPQSGVARMYPSTDLADAYSICLPPGTSNDPEALARFIFSHQPSWIAWLTNLRDMIVAGLGCLAVPYGTLLGVFTFVVLGRPSVVRLFDGEARS